jgi:hypothetical protein
MQFQVTQIDFDWGDDDWGIVHPDDIEEGEKYKNKIINSVLNQVYTLDEEDELVDLISDETGWCIKSLQYQQIK